LKEQNLKKIVATRPPSPVFQDSAKIDLSCKTIATQMSSKQLIGMLKSVTSPEQISYINLRGQKSINISVMELICGGFPNLQRLDLPWTDTKTFSFLQDQLNKKRLSQLNIVDFRGVRLSADNASTLRTWAENHQHETRIYLDCPSLFTSTIIIGKPHPLQFSSKHPVYDTYKRFGFFDPNGCFSNKNKVVSKFIKIGPVTFINTGKTPSTQR
jgi:hypothetical protein